MERKSDSRPDTEGLLGAIALLVVSAAVFGYVFISCCLVFGERQKHVRSCAAIQHQTSQLSRETFGRSLRPGGSAESQVNRRLEDMTRILNHHELPQYIPIVTLLEDVKQAVGNAGIEGLVWLGVEVKTAITPATPLSILKLRWTGDEAALSTIREAFGESRFMRVTDTDLEQNAANGDTVATITLGIKGPFKPPPPPPPVGPANREERP